MMSRRSSRNRRRARKARILFARNAENEAAARRRLEPKAPLSDGERARALSRFTHITGRGGVVLRSIVWGPLVSGSTPEELRENTERALIEITMAQELS